MTVAERRQLGREARARVPRKSHANYEAAAKRPDPVDLLASQAATRVEELVPIRYGRMAVSPFTFYRGAALVMASDLATTATSGITVQCCGDAHLLNFGLFGTPERSLMFDVNDFDETLPGPWEWDVKRLAASLAIAGRDRGFTAKERRRINTAVGARYRQAMARFAGIGNLDVWYQHADVEQFMAQYRDKLAPVTRRRTEKGLQRARLQDSMKAVDKLTSVVDGQRRITADPPGVVPLDDVYPDARGGQLRASMHDLIRAYSRSLQSDRQSIIQAFRLTDMARKVVGVGSVGTRCWILLLLGRDDDDPLFLQAKEAEKSVLARYVGKSKYSNQGQRVVAGQHLMQAASDIFLGWERLESPDGQKRDFYVRQLRDWKGSVNVEQMIPTGMEAYAHLCAWTLARAHARSGDRIAISSYLGNSAAFEQATAEFAETYADQNERDFDTFKQAIASGRIEATMGV